MACLAGPSFHEANGSAARAMVAVKATTPTSAAASRFGLYMIFMVLVGFGFGGLVNCRFDRAVKAEDGKPAFLRVGLNRSSAFSSVGFVLILLQFCTAFCKLSIGLYVNRTPVITVTVNAFIG